MVLGAATVTDLECWAPPQNCPCRTPQWNKPWIGWFQTLFFQRFSPLDFLGRLVHHFGCFTEKKLPNLQSICLQSGSLVPMLLAFDKIPWLLITDTMGVMKQQLRANLGFWGNLERKHPQKELEEQLF